MERLLLLKPVLVGVLSHAGSEFLPVPRKAIRSVVDDQRLIIRHIVRQLKYYVRRCSSSTNEKYFFCKNARALPKVALLSKNGRKAPKTLGLAGMKVGAP